MPPRTIHKLAQEDTPAAVTVPNNWAGVLAWATGRFGGAAVVASCLAWGLVSIYADQQKYNERMIQVFEKQAENSANMTASMFALKIAIEQLASEARIAHRRDG